MKHNKKTFDNKENSTGKVRAKKHLGQHFLNKPSIAKQIAETLPDHCKNVLEIGPGMGVLTQFLVGKYPNVVAMDIDRDSIAYLNTNFKEENGIENEEGFQVVEADFLKANMNGFFREEEYAIIGNYPYNISTQIVFKMLENRTKVPVFSGMFQKEVAQRICAKEGSKIYGILSVLCQAFYEASYLFTVHPESFSPPPKVQSGVLLLKRKENQTLDCDEKLLFKVVKMAFQQRRKTLRNSLKTLGLSDQLKEDSIFAQRPEQLSVEEFIALTSKIGADAVSTD
jgi:16S rRNA (adenine1518-N6/adenine1519-N6)-dimethyltransferase